MRVQVQAGGGRSWGGTGGSEGHLLAGCIIGVLVVGFRLVNPRQSALVLSGRSTHFREFLAFMNDWIGFLHSPILVLII